jgi:hypothetical protein
VFIDVHAQHGRHPALQPASNHTLIQRFEPAGRFAEFRRGAVLPGADEHWRTVAHQSRASVACRSAILIAATALATLTVSAVRAALLAIAAARRPIAITPLPLIAVLTGWVLVLLSRIALLTLLRVLLLLGHELSFAGF